MTSSLALCAGLLAPSVALAEPSVDDARGLLLRGRFPAAITVLQDVVHRDADRAEAWRTLAVAYEAMGHAPEAVRAYRRYLALSPGADDVELVMLRVARLVRGLGWDPGEVRTALGQLRT